MDKTLKYVFILSIILFSLNVNAQKRQHKKNYISIVVPEEVNTETTLSRYRIAGNTLPGSKVTINGKKFKVYPSGAFAGLMKLHLGTNEFIVKSTYKSNRTVGKKFTIVRKDDKLRTTPIEKLVIEDDLMLPDKEIWLDSGDLLKVRFKGTPGCKATFMDNKPMTELPLEETKGVGGIYTGVYKIQPTDEIINQFITFQLQRKGEKITEKTNVKISVIPNQLPRVGIITAERSFLNYGLGTNRLGGAKLSFLEKGIKLTINGMSGNQYRVKLTDDMEAWIPKEQVELLPIGTFIPKSLTDSWAVYGGKKYDKIIINLNEKLPYSTRQEINPTRIIVDIYGATSNTNWITQHISAKEIKNLYYEQVSKDLFRIIIEPTHKQIWGYDISYKNTALQIKIKKQPKKLRISNLTFILDAGHGGSNRGALGSTGLLEKEVTLDIVKRLERQLKRKGAKVILTRSKDVESKSVERLKKIKKLNADVLISIHANSIGLASDPIKTKGTATFYKHICYRPLSLAIYRRMLNLNLEPFGNVGSFNFTLNSPTEIPNVLVETAFMSNPSDEMKLKSARFKNKIAQKIVLGVEDFLKKCKNNFN